MCYRINNFNWMTILFFTHTSYCNTSIALPLSVAPSVSLNMSVWHPMSVWAKSKTDLWYANHNSIIRPGGQCEFSILLYSIFQNPTLGIFYCVAITHVWRSHHYVSDGYAICDCITISYLFIFLMAVIRYIFLLTTLGLYHKANLFSH
jgi:hypothetical protein